MNTRRLAAAGAAVAVLGLTIYLAAPRVGASVDCTTFSRPTLVVNTTRHVLTLCDAGSGHGTFHVRLGKHGTGKSREGDGKTPLGLYPLTHARPSVSFGSFAPIGYPTAEQTKRGFTGSAVGVHGPDRRVRWLGRFVNTFDSTDGCIGLATDTEMLAVATWIREHHAGEILIE